MRGPAPQLALVPITALVGLAADHDEAGRVPGAAETAQGVEERLEPLDRRDAPHVEQQWPAREPERGPRRLRVARGKQGGVDTAGNDGDLRRVGAVLADQVPTLDHVGR